MLNKMKSIKRVVNPVIVAVIFCLLSLPTTAQAQRMHAVILSDTSPWANWGLFLPSVTMDTASMFSLCATNVPEGQLEFHPLEISENALGDPRQIARFIQDIRVAPNDTLLFYFSGHGGHDDRGQYLAFAGGRLYRDELRALMKQKGARLNVIITDCCNQRMDGEDFAAPSMDMEPPPAVTPLFRSLFFEPQGLVDINSSSPGEAAFFAPLGGPPEAPVGSLFTIQIANFVYRFRQQRTTWDHFMRSVSLNVHLAFRSGYPNGAVGNKGGKFQSDQNVYAYEYPGMPAKQGPRSGFTVRDSQNRGAVITQVRAGFPASQVYDLSARRYVALQPGEVIVAANNLPIRTVAEIVDVIKNSPQVMRLKIRNSRGDREVLMRLRY
jgi:hypothetical protein